MTDTTAKIRAKGLDSTGITEEIANLLFANKGKHIMAIVELKSAERHEKVDGTKRVDLTLELVEPATDDNLSEHLRELTRGLYAARAQADGQQAIDDTLTPSIEDAVKGGSAFKPHPFIPQDASAETPMCDVCGNLVEASLHTDRAGMPDPFEIPQEDSVST